MDLGRTYSVKRIAGTHITPKSSLLQVGLRVRKSNEILTSPSKKGNLPIHLFSIVADKAVLAVEDFSNYNYSIYIQIIISMYILL